MSKELKRIDTKKRNKFIKASKIKEGQEELCRFVTIEYQIIKKVNGKYRRIGSKTENGLQVKNKVYLINGKYKMANSGSLRVTKKYDQIPEWATEELIVKYKQFYKVND